MAKRTNNDLQNTTQTNNDLQNTTQKERQYNGQKNKQ